MKFTKKQKLVQWLQNYANEHSCYVCINSDYSPCVIAINGNPIRRYDEENGYWYWTYHGKGKSKWIDDEIPEELKLTRFDLIERKGIIIMKQNFRKSMTQ